MIRALFLIWLFLVPCARAQYRMLQPNSYYLPENWPERTLKLSDRGNLRDLYASGFDFHFVPGLQEDFIESKHARVRVVEPSGRVLPEFAMERAEVRCHPPDSNLSKIIFASQPMTLSQAREGMRPWLPYIGRTEAELEFFLRAVEEDPVTYQDPDFGKVPHGFNGGWSGSLEERYSVWFRKGYNPVVPVILCVRIDWNPAMTPAERITSHDSPIKPPPGYEHRVISEGKHYGPDSTSEMMHAKGIPFPPGTGLGGSVSDVIEMNEDGTPRRHVRGEPVPVSLKQPEKKPENISRKEERASRPTWIWWIATVFLGIGLVAWTRRKKRND